MKKIVVIGGTSGFGRWAAESVVSIFKDQIELVVTGTDEQKTKDVSSKIGCKFSLNNIQAVDGADVVIVSVPISITNRVIQDIGPFLKKGCVLADVTSVKIKPSEFMNKYIENGVIVIPTHPVFGPFVKNIRGQVVVLTPIDEIKLTTEYLYLKSLLNDLGAKIIECSPQKHDEMMSIVQGITHFSLFVIGETLRRLNVDMNFANQFVSPVYKLMTSTVARYMNQNPALYADIQLNNDLNLPAHEVFIKTAQDFNKYVKNSDKQSFIDNVKLTSEYFGTNALKGQKYTDKLIYMMAKQLNGLNQYLGKAIIIENIYTKSQISGILNNYDEEIIVIDGENYIFDEWILLG